jgi:hypothetical protein
MFAPQELGGADLPRLQLRLALIEQIDHRGGPVRFDEVGQVTKISAQFNEDALQCTGSGEALAIIGRRK